MSKAGPMINIGGDEKDASYRYKMPPLITKVEGRGNGIKTILVNITDVCKHLHTEPQYATRFFGVECGAVSKWDDKRDAGIVHGVHERNELQKSLKKFVREFILCPKCHLPELQMKVKQEKSLLLIRCGACGYKGKNNSPHKVKQYMINHPPPSKGKSGVSKKIKEDKDKESSKKKGDSSKGNTDGKEAELNSNVADLNRLGGEDDEVWSVSVTEEAVAKRREYEMQMKMSSQTFENKENDNENDDNDENNDNDKNDENNNNNNEKNENSETTNGTTEVTEATEDDDPDLAKAAALDPYRSTVVKSATDDSGPAHILRSFMNEKKREIYEILDEIKRLGLAHGLDDAKRTKVTFEATCKFETSKKLITSLKKHKDLFKQLNRKDKDSEIFFGCLEEIIAHRNPDLLLPKTYEILEAIYDAEIASEDQILSWYHTESDKALLLLRDEAEQVRKMAQPFIKWLEEDDEEDGDEDDDDDDDDDADAVVDIE